MTLHMQSDTSFISTPGSKSIDGGYHYLSTTLAKPKAPQTETPTLNGPIYAECTTMNNVSPSTMEEEIGDSFVYFQQGDVLRSIIHKIGHSHPPTPITTDSATVNGFANENIRKFRTIAIEIKLYWV